MRRRKVLSYIVFNLKIISFRLSLISNDVYYTAISWISIDFSMIIYFCLLIVNEMLQIKFSIMLTALCLFINFIFIWRKYDFHFNLKFSWIFNILKSVLALTRCSFNIILMFMLYFLKVLEKWISSCFRSLNLKSCLFAHSTTFFHVFSNISQFCSVDSLYVNMLMSFTNSVTLKRNLIFSHDFNRFTL